MSTNAHREAEAPRAWTTAFSRAVPKSLLAVLVASILVVQGCASIRPRNPVPEELIAKAGLPGIPRARFWGDESPAYHRAWLSQSRAELEANYSGILDREHNYLAISGGGAKGAYGAGFLVGWSEADTRPEFTIVTGVSIGAVTALFAFLGPDYDDELEEMFTTYSTKDIIKKGNRLTALWRESVTSSEPFKALIAHYVDEAMLEALAAEHRRGRRLFITTTNLDAGRPVMWNAGAIATSGSPQALELLREVIRASASIPGVFPPIYIEVEADGQRYDEMHVDGGATTQVMLYPVGVDWKRVQKKLRTKGRPTVYIIGNTFFDPQYKPVKPRLGPISRRSIESLIRTQGIGDIYRIYFSTRRDGLDYRLTYIRGDFEGEPQETFDPEYMKQLFALGRRLGRDGAAWKETPPGLEPH